MKNWLIKAELFWDASRIETITVRANTERKAKIFAKESFKKKYPNVGNMINIIEVKMEDN